MADPNSLLDVQAQTLTETQSAILLELNKILWTVNQINTSLKKTLALTKPAPSILSPTTNQPTPLSAQSQSQFTAAAIRASGVDVEEVGALVKALHEAMASGKSVFGKALGLDREGGGGDGDRDGDDSQGEEGAQGD